MEREGMSTFDALMEAGKSRIRPIVMTTASMIVGMMPIALSSSSGSEWKAGLAWALIGGLTSSMFLTLLLVPVIYMRMELWREKVPALFRSVFRRKEKAAAEPQGVLDFQKQSP
jgi:HAE1 family hydrophobic/amphiphilic exporter-1